MSEENKDKNIGYSQFLKLCNVGSPKDWYGMAVRPDGVWVKLPSDDALLLPSERAALSEHPKNDLTIPALAFPCSIGELQQFLDWLSNYLGSSIEPVELPMKESETQPINEPSFSEPFDAGAFFNSIQPDNSKVGIPLKDVPTLDTRKSTPSLLIERDEAKECALWKKHIEPIIFKHNLRTKEGKLFEYQFIPKNIYNDDVLLILRRTMCICDAIEFQEAEISDKLGVDNFITKILCRLRDYETDLQKAYRKANGRQVDLRIIFQDFLNELITKKTLPEFLELLCRELPSAKAETEAHVSIQIQEDIKQKLSMEDYIQQRRTNGAKDEIIAYELHDKKGNFKMTYANLADILGLGNDLNKNQFATLKQRGKRACDKGKAMACRDQKKPMKLSRCHGYRDKA